MTAICQEESSIEDGNPRKVIANFLDLGIDGPVVVYRPVLPVVERNLQPGGVFVVHYPVCISDLRPGPERCPFVSWSVGSDSQCQIGRAGNWALMKQWARAGRALIKQSSMLPRRGVPVATQTSSRALFSPAEVDLTRVIICECWETPPVRMVRELFQKVAVGRHVIVFVFYFCM